MPAFASPYSSNSHASLYTPALAAEGSCGDTRAPQGLKPRHLLIFWHGSSRALPVVLVASTAVAATHQGEGTSLLVPSGLSVMTALAAEGELRGYKSTSGAEAPINLRHVRHPFDSFVSLSRSGQAQAVPFRSCSRRVALWPPLMTGRARVYSCR